MAKTEDKTIIYAFLTYCLSLRHENPECSCSHACSFLQRKLVLSRCEAWLETVSGCPLSAQ